jgi:hypothetical protein
MLDKTGTLTDDRLVILDIATAATGAERAELLGWLATIEARSSHPVARAFAALPRPRVEPRVLALRAVPGCGVEAEIEANGRRHGVRIGTPDWVRRDAGRGTIAEQVRVTGHTVHVAVNGELAAVAVLAERVRDSAADAVAGFRRLGLPVVVLTGDTVERAAAMNLPARAGLLPDDKRAAVEAVKAAGGRPLVVGDGINDASALAAAHAGVALSSGTDLAVSAADVTLYHADLRVLPWAVELSREAVRAVRRNLRRAVAYNLVGMTFAACGVLHPVVAVLLMVVSSLSLLVSSTRVGVVPEVCSDRGPGLGGRGAGEPVSWKAVAHGFALALQGVVFLLLLEPARGLPAAFVLGGFAIAGFALAHLWHRWQSIPHTLDMCVGMLTLGNLGMLLGWWADSGFAPLPDGGCCGCVEAMREGVMRPWMWAGMLALANAAMAWLPRRSGSHTTDHAAAMYSGGNAGMVLGMLAGGWLAAGFATESVPLAAAASFAGMTAGMLAGMLAGTWLTERFIAAVRAARVLPRWLGLHFTK